MAQIPPLPPRGPAPSMPPEEPKRTKPAKDLFLSADSTREDVQKFQDNWLTAIALVAVKGHG